MPSKIFIRTTSNNDMHVRGFVIDPASSMTFVWWAPLMKTSILSGDMTSLRQQQYLVWLRKNFLSGKHFSDSKHNFIEEVMGFYKYDWSSFPFGFAVYKAIYEFAELFLDGWDVNLVCNCDSKWCHGYIIRDAIIKVAQKRKQNICK